MSKVEDVRREWSLALTSVAGGLSRSMPIDDVIGLSQRLDGARERLEAAVRADALEPYQELVEAARGVALQLNLTGRCGFGAFKRLRAALDALPSEPVERTSMTDELSRHYSGRRSRRFWDRINALPEPSQSKAYALGVALQNAELVCLRAIEAAEGVVERGQEE